MPLREIIITKDTTLTKNAVMNARLVIKASGVTIDGNGATLVGGTGKPETFKGIGILSNGNSDVTLKNIKVKGFGTALQATDGSTWRITGCDFSDNYHNPAFGWGNGERQGGVILTRINRSKIYSNTANRVWNGIDLDNCNDNEIFKNDFSHCSNVCLKMLTASRNIISDNNLSYGIRISPGEVHARDSTGVLIESGSNNNKLYRNDVRYGGDGIFIRVLNNFVSTGNLFQENDCSYANNNCVESWSPGNTFIKNKANHGSYGFWMGGSDQTIMLDNEAAYNGLPNEKHNAPEPDFGHGGIVFVNGSSNHIIVQGNYCHHNGGGGIVLRGDRATQGKAWRAYHWIIQNNRLEFNQWGIFAMYADWVHVANNKGSSNAQEDNYEQVTNLYRESDANYMGKLPRAVMKAPKTAKVGEEVVFDATNSFSPTGDPIYTRWDIGEANTNKSKLTHTFKKPGFYRVGLTVHDGVMASMAYRDLIVASPVEEITDAEDDLQNWGYEIEGNADGKAKMIFENDTDAVVGKNSVRFRPVPYPGMGVSAIYPKQKNAKWNLSGKSRLTFWIRAENPNPTGFQGVAPIVKLFSSKGTCTLMPTGDKNLLRDGGYSEARWTWMRVEIPLKDADPIWKREGEIDFAEVQGISFTLDSFENSPFTVWLDGIGFE
jgi:parallel beta-helix repeat protein